MNAMSLIGGLAACLALTLAGPPVSGQVAPDAVTVPAPEAADETAALIERIRQTLVGIDDGLLEAPDAEEPLAALDAVIAAHEQVIRDLEELIQQAKYRQGSSGGGGGGGGGGGPPPPGGGADQPPPPRPSDGSEGSPSGADRPQPPEDGRSGGDQPQDGQPADAQPADGQPQGGAASPEPGADRLGGPPPPDPLVDPTRSDTQGRWGLLPPKVQERLMNLHVDDVPARYRDWLSAYIRALSAAEQERDGR